MSCRMEISISLFLAIIKSFAENQKGRLTIMLRIPANTTLYGSAPVYSPEDPALLKPIAGPEAIHAVLRQNTAHAKPEGYYRVITECGEYFYKIIPHNRKETMQRADFFAALFGKSVKTCQATEYANLDNSYSVAIYPCIAGGYFQGGLDHVLLLADVVARLHLAARKIPAEVQDNVKKSNATWLCTLNSTAKEFIAEPDTVVPHTQAVKNILEAVPPLVQTEQAQIIHGDINPGNFLFYQGGGTLLDFEDTHMSWFAPELEIAFILERFIFAQQQDDAWKNTACEVFLRTYSAVSPHNFTKEPGLFCRCLEQLKYIALSRLVHSVKTAGLQVPVSEWEKFIFLWKNKGAYTSAFEQCLCTIE